MAHRLFYDDGTPIKKLKSNQRDGITGIPMESGELQINLNLPPVHYYLHVLSDLENTAFTFNARKGILCMAGYNSLLKVASFSVNKSQEVRH